jgi:hypothetical protein
MLQTCARDDASIDARKLYDYLPERGHARDDSSSVNSAIHLLLTQMVRILKVFIAATLRLKSLGCLDDPMRSNDSC